MSREPIASRDTTAARLTDALRECILTHELPPGQSLHQQELARRFGCSRIPLREALCRLEAEGLVELRPRRGAVVIALSVADLREIMELRACLTQLAVRLALPRLGDDAFLRLEALLARLESESNPRAWGALITEFHALLTQVPECPRLMDLLRGLQEQSQRYRTVGFGTPRLRRLVERGQRDLLASCRTRDPAAAERGVAAYFDALVAASGRDEFAATPGDPAPARSAPEAVPEKARLVDELREDILADAFPPHQPLRQEALAKRYAVSRIPLREALRQLEAEGLVLTQPRRGTRVVPMGRAELAEFLEVRLAVSRLALRITVPRLTEDDLRRGEGLLEALVAESDPHRWDEGLSAIYALLFSAPDRPRLMRLLTSLNHQGRRPRHAWFTDARMRFVVERELRKFLAAWHTHDPERVFGALRDYARGLFDAYAAVSPSPAEPPPAQPRTAASRRPGSPRSARS